MATAVATCVHCGFCLPTCPTYEVMGDEADSPRGRIILMKEVLEGNLQPDQAAAHIDRCLGCVACETACPSGVRYGELLNSYRAIQPSGSSGSLLARLRRKIAAWTVPYPKRFAWAMRAGMLTKRLAGLAPAGLKPLVDLIPEELPPAERPAELSPATGTPVDTVTMHIGCAAQTLNPEITAAAIRVLNRCGVTVQVPADQVCCGALHWHIGDAARAGKLAKANLAAFGDSQQPILTTAAGCGSGMHEYPLILAGDQQRSDGQQFASRVADISVYLASDKVSLPPMRVDRPIRIAYHDACHLAHAQQVRQPPRDLLQQIQGVQLVPIADAELCCGSAGTYNIDQPEIADELGRRKAQTLVDTRCDLVALGNIGCQVQIQQHLRRRGSEVPVLHVVQILDLAQQGQLESLLQPDDSPHRSA